MAKDVEVRRNSGDQMSGRERLSGSMSEMMPNLERMVESFFGNRFGSMLGDWPTLTPRTNLDVRETDRAYVMSVDLPGFAQNEIRISVDGNLLNISAEHQDRSTQQRQQRSFRQSFTLPSHVETQQIEANCENGILEVYIPKTESAASRKIEVQTGKGGFLNRLLGRDQSKAEEEH